MSTSKIWSRLSVTRKSDGAVLKFRFQEATVDEKNEVLDFLKKYFITQEKINKCAGISKSEEATQERLKIWNELYEKLLILICCEDTDYSNKSIVGLSMIVLETEDNEDFQNIEKELKRTIITSEGKKLMHILRVIHELYDERKRLGLTRYYADRGLCVHPAYTGLGIATELFRLRRVISKEHGIPATGAWMTAIGSQKAAERDGWNTVFEIPFDELGRLTECDFKDAPPTCKLMVAFVEN